MDGTSFCQDKGLHCIQEVSTLLALRDQCASITPRRRNAGAILMGERYICTNQYCGQAQTADWYLGL